MAVSGINNYRDVLYQWQGQQLKSTGSSASNTSQSSLINSLFGGSSMTSQISSLVELTKYAMDAMGVSGDTRVTFSQITRYREQLQDSFTESVKKALGASGVSNLSALEFSIDKDGKITVSGGEGSDSKNAQAWLDANPGFGEDLLKALPSDAFEEGQSIKFTLSNAGTITVINDAQKQIQGELDKLSDVMESLREKLAQAGITLDSSIELEFGEDGALVVSGDSEQAEAINKILEDDTRLADAIRKEMEKQNVHESAVSVRINKTGAAQVTVNNGLLNRVQSAMNNTGGIGQKIATGLNNFGIDPNINFSIQVNDDGSVNIISDHADRDKLQQFFDDNPELVKTYRQIEALAGIDDARKSMQVAPSEMRKRIQIESMVSWWTDSGNSSSYFGNYYDGRFSLLSGLNMNV